MATNYWKLHEDVCFKKAGGKIIWQPRVQCWRDDKLFEDGKLPGIYEGMDDVQMFKELGCSSRVYEYGWCIESYYDETVTTRFERKGDVEYYYIDTPIGTVWQEIKLSKNSWARFPSKWYITSEEDMKIFTYIEAHTFWRYREDRFNAVKEKWGDLGAPTMFIQRVNIQRLYIDLMGAEETIYALVDYPETVDAYCKALHESQMRMLDAVIESPLMIINFGDNVHSGLLPASIFEEYVLPEYKIRNEILHKAGRFTHAHFDGDNKGLLEYYKETGLDGIEAITPVPQGDVTLEEVKEALGDMYLIDGIPAVYFDEIYPEQTLIDCVNKIIDLFAPNLILGISDEISSTGDIERIRLVGKIVDEYNAKIEAQNK